jgi:hypothetical protein
VLDLVTTRGAEGATPRAIAAQLTASGRSTSDASVSSTLSRLKNDHRVYNERGLWFASSVEKASQQASVAPIEEAGEDPLFDDETEAADDDLW